jgi:hypothetical protein
LPCCCCCCLWGQVWLFCCHGRHVRSPYAFYNSTYVMKEFGAKNGELQLLLPLGSCVADCCCCTCC